MSTSYKLGRAARPVAALRGLFTTVLGPLRTLFDSLTGPLITGPGGDGHAADSADADATGPAADKLWQERVLALGTTPLFSIIMPAYRTPAVWLRRAVDSIRAQRYPHWELCLVDDGSADAAFARVLTELGAADTRIRVFEQPHNQGISAASNVGVANSRGEFLALVDHDDELTPDALYWMAHALAAQPTADILYSDEDKIDTRGVRTEPFVKPAFSPELLFNCMYVGHLTVYRKSLVEQVGGFRSAFDFSQDYDLMLRATEATTAIVHVPRVLYHWRKVPGSGSTPGGKLDARVSNLAALQSALDRRGIAATTRGLPTANRVCFTQPPTPRVSLIIPSDSERNIVDALNSIDQHTRYPDFEIVLVTSSALAKKIAAQFSSDRPRRGQLRFHAFDKPFNFSLKCNEGAQVASGEIVVFFNDDVRPLEAHWIHDLIEYLALPGVGAVAPKLLYEDRKVQHAGLVTGVRGLVGTAFHSLPEDTPQHFNFVQSVRDVAALSGACLAMRRTLFYELEGFDATRFPINHSDVDLCFRIREQGLRCVYTPYATLLHIGHLSLGEFDKKRKQKKDKADIELLKRWAGAISHDPYFPAPMRDLLYRDSPPPIRMYGKDRRQPYPLGVDALFISHDLSASGAPLVLFYAVQALVARGGFAVVLTRCDGPFRARYEELGVMVICDEQAFADPTVQKNLLASFDVVVANTIECWRFIPLAKQLGVPSLWYIHESSTINLWLQHVPGFHAALHQAPTILVGSYRSLRYVQSWNSRARIFTYGVADFSRPVPAHDKLVIALLGTIEPRKGQDLLLRAIDLLAPAHRDRAEFHVVGRVLDFPAARQLHAELQEAAARLPNLKLRGVLSLEEYQETLLAADIIVCPSRDDTLPLVTVDALSCGKPLIVSNATGTVDFMTHGVHGLVFATEDAAHLAVCLERLIDEPELQKRLAKAGRELFLQHFSLAGYGERFVALLLETAGSAAVPTARRHEVAA